uniref:Uncharacterized protein n=1 Tax=Noccaea caerulescens TaxID=107243 RepID=A0A1J3IHK5_NOCCA
MMMVMMMRIVCEWSDEDCMKVDEGKQAMSFVIPRLGNFDPLASFGSPRNQQIIIFYYRTLFLFCLCSSASLIPFGLVWFGLTSLISLCLCVECVFGVVISCVFLSG